jgi:hypothetical protein
MDEQHLNRVRSIATISSLIPMAAIAFSRASQRAVSKADGNRAGEAHRRQRDAGADLGHVILMSMVPYGAYYLFGLEAFDWRFQAVTIGRAIVVADDPLFVARLFIGQKEVEDLSSAMLGVGPSVADRVLAELEPLAEGTEITPAQEHVYELFAEHDVVGREIKAAFVRRGIARTIVRDRFKYGRILSEFVDGETARQHA